MVENAREARRLGALRARDVLLHRRDDRFDGHRFTEQARSRGACGVVVPDAMAGGFGRSFGTVSEGRFPDASIGLSLSVPVFNRGARGDLAIAKAQRSQAEILVAQQAGMPKEAHFAQTHLLLGNLYQQSGNLDKAKAAWAAGLALFPDDAELKHKLELAGG